MNISSKAVNKDLRDKGLDNQKSKSLSKDIFSHIPESIMNHFIRGFFDGDGHVSKNKCHQSVVFYSTYDFLLGLKYELEKRLDFKFYLNKTSNEKLFQLRTTIKIKVNLLKKYLYNDATVWLERKKEIFDSLPEPKKEYRYITHTKYNTWVVECKSRKIFKTLKTITEALEYAKMVGLDTNLLTPIRTDQAYKMGRIKCDSRKVIEDGTSKI